MEQNFESYVSSVIRPLHRTTPDERQKALQARLAELAASDDLDALQAHEDAAWAQYQTAAKQLGALRRKAASSIVIPKAGAGALEPGLLGPGGLPAGGKLKLK